MIVDILLGSQGVGKTSVISNLIRKHDGRERIVVLVPDTTELQMAGIQYLQRRDDGDRAGYYCARLKADVRTQIKQVSAAHSPQRLLIEPSARIPVATVLEVVRKTSFEGAIRQIRRILVIDASRFPQQYSSSMRFFDSQVQVSDVVLVNKCDLANRDDVAVAKQRIQAINPEAQVLTTVHGDFDVAEYRGDSNLAPAMAAASQMESHISTFEGCFDLESLLSAFNGFASGRMGNVMRAKGLFNVGSGWRRIDYEDGSVFVQESGDSVICRVTIVGSNLKANLLEQSLASCLIK